MPEKEKKISLPELQGADGKAGQPAYIAYQGRVVNVSSSALWEGGRHMGHHQAGRDLTAELQDAPHGVEVLDRYPQVGILADREESAPLVREEPRGPAIPEALARLLKRFPLLRRHPHPMVVHFPIVLMIATSFFTLLSVLTGDPAFDDTAFNCLGGGILFTPVAMVTGLASWWFNYELRPLRPVIIKITLSPLLLAVAVVVFVWRLLDAEVLVRLQGWSVLYVILVLLLTPLVSAIGWYGAKLTFPSHGDLPEEN